MKSLKLASCLAAAATLVAGAANAQAAAAKPASAAKAPNEAKAPVEPGARAALDRMAAYLRTLEAFQVKTETSLDLVTDAGQRVQIDGTASYEVRRPNGFVISVNTDWKKRSFYYDGKQFTIYAPELGYYASAPAPATIAQTLDTISDKFGIELPIEDLFRWNDPSARRSQTLDSAMDVGPATIDGAQTEHYAFRQGQVDWQVWIQDGDQPLPRKLVIVDRTDPAQPAYAARLTWTLNPAFAADAFTFHPGKEAKAIRLTTLDNGRQP